LDADDSRLISGCRQGREEDYRQLLSRYEGYIYSLCYRLLGHREDALEMSQEAMLKVVTNLGSYQLNRPFKPWLRKVVVNVCLNFLRQRQTATLSLDRTMEEDLPLEGLLAAGSESDPTSRAEWLDTRNTLQQALKGLPPPLRLVLVLRHQEGMSYQEIADVMQLPLGTVKTNLFRARRLLRRILQDAYGWEEFR
jgi:RNA polymerase sigma-70 factor (ECF subfamily)